MSEAANEEALKEAVNKALASLRKALREYWNTTGKVPNFIMGHSPKSIPQERLAHCKVYCDRERLIASLGTPRIVAEVGTAEGNFARFLLELIDPEELHLFDDDLTKRLRPDVSGSSRVYLHEGDSSANLLSMADMYFDLIYVDAGHSYIDVKKDCEAAVKKIKEDGFIVFNDYTLWSPVEGAPYGVVHAVNEMIVDGWDVVGFAIATHGYHDIALQKRISPSGARTSARL